MGVFDVLAAIKDVVLAIAGAVTATAAVLGLKTWQRELKGKAEFDTARALGKATYKLREAVQLCRVPFFPVEEFPLDYDGFHSSPQQEAKLWQHIYKNRWAPVATALQEFDAAVLEAEALWGRDLRARTDELRRCVVRVNVAIHVDSPLFRRTRGNT